MKKILIIATIALVLVLTAVACTGNNEPADTTVETGAETVADTAADTTVDTAVDTTVDTAVDTTVDTAVDTTVDTTVETVAETTVDTAAVEETEAVTEAATQPAPVEKKVAVDFNNCTITGHAPNLVAPDPTPGATTHGAMVHAAGFQEGEYAVLLYKGSLGLGEVDLSKYSKIIITYTCDVTNTGDAYDANANNRVMLTNAACNDVMSPADESVILKSADYTRPSANWALTQIEIDLSDLNDTTDLYITFDFLTGAFFLVGAVEFVEVPAAEVAA